MHWFKVIYSLAAVFMVIGFFWKIAILPLALFSLIFNDKLQKFFMILAMLIPYYLMACYSVLVGIGMENGEKDTSTLIVGGLFLILNGLMGIGQAQSNAERENDYEAYRFAGYRYFTLLAAVIFYVYAIFNINLTLNWLTIGLYNIMQWIQGLPIVGFLIGISALLYAIYMLIIVFAMLVTMIVQVIQKKELSNDSSDIKA